LFGRSKLAGAARESVGQSEGFLEDVSALRLGLSDQPKASVILKPFRNGEWLQEIAIAQTTESRSDFLDIAEG
jgi:hypothetical protein